MNKHITSIIHAQQRALIPADRTQPEKKKKKKTPHPLVFLLSSFNPTHNVIPYRSVISRVKSHHCFTACFVRVQKEKKKEMSGPISRHFHSKRHEQSKLI
jgi:hypothetical protein